MDDPSLEVTKIPSVVSQAFPVESGAPSKEPLLPSQRSKTRVVGILLLVFIIFLGIGGYFFYKQKPGQGIIEPQTMNNTAPSSTSTQLSSRVLLGDSGMDNRVRGLFVSYKDNLVYYFDATSGRAQIFANGGLSPEYDSLLNETLVSDDQHLIISSATRLRKDFIIVNGKESRPYDGINRAPIMSPDGKHYAYVAFAGNKQMSVLDGKEVWVANKAYANTISGGAEPIFSETGHRVAFIIDKGDHSDILIFDTETGEQLKELTAHSPSHLVLNNDGSILGYIDDSEVVVQSLRLGSETKKRYPVGTQSLPGKLVLSSDGAHFVYGDLGGPPSSNPRLLIDGKVVSTPIPYGANLLTLLIDQGGDKVAFEISGGSSTGVVVYNMEGELIGDYQIPNKDGRYVSYGMIAFASSSIIELVTHVTLGVSSFKQDHIVLINGKETTIPLRDIFPILTQKEQKNFLGIIKEARSWKLIDPEFESYSNIGTLVYDSNAEMVAIVRSNIGQYPSVMDNANRPQSFIQIGKASTSVYDQVSLPIINKKEKYISFGALSGGQVLHEVYDIGNDEMLHRRSPVDMSPLYSINRTNIYGNDALGDIHATPAESSRDMTFDENSIGVQIDLHFPQATGSQALITLSVDTDTIGSFYEGDTMNATTTQQFIFLRRYTGKHKLTFRIEALNSNVRSSVGISNVLLLTRKK